MKLLFVHQNFPGQYLHLARHFGAQPSNAVVFLTQRKDSTLPGVRKLIYTPKRKPTRQTHHYLRETEAGVLNGQEIAKAARAQKGGLRARHQGAAR